MKICFLSYYSGKVYRGAETFCDAIASNLGRNHQVKVFQSKFFEEKKPYQIIKINSKSIFSFTLKSLFQITKFKPDIIIPINGRWMSLIIKIYTLFSKSKMVISGQAGLGFDEKWNLFLRPSLFISLSYRNDKWVKKFSPNQKTAIINNGVDLNKFKPTQKSNPFDLSRPIILCVAGPEKYKRVEETIHAVYALNNSSLIVLGGNKETQELGQKLLGKNFKQIKVRHDKIPDIYNSANLFTLVSETEEAFGISYLEAMACNLPIVATDDELRHEIIGSVGLFIKNPENPKEYAKVLQKALENKWTNLPRIQAEKFSWPRISSVYAFEFKKILNA